MLDQQFDTTIQAWQYAYHDSAPVEYGIYVDRDIAIAGEPVYDVDMMLEQKRADIEAVRRAVDNLI